MRLQRASSICSSASGYAEKPTETAMKHGRTCSNISRCSTTRSASTSGTGCCHPSSSKGSRKSEPRASTKLGAIHYDSRAQLERHLDDFIAVYSFGRRLKTLKGLTPFEFICKRWAAEPHRFRLNPLHQIPGLPPPDAIRNWTIRFAITRPGSRAAARRLGAVMAIGFALKRGRLYDAPRGSSCSYPTHVDASGASSLRK